MTTTPGVGELAGVLRRHRLHASMNICIGCDWRAMPGVGSLADQHAAHVVEAVLAHLRAVAADEGVRERVRVAVLREMARDGDNDSVATALAAFLAHLDAARPTDARGAGEGGGDE